MKSEFCTTIPKEENRGLTVVHRHRLNIRAKKILMCEDKDTELICAHLITRSFTDSTKNIYTNQILKSCVHDARNQSEISDEEKIDQSHWSTVTNCSNVIGQFSSSRSRIGGLRTFFSLKTF